MGQDERKRKIPAESSSFLAVPEAGLEPAQPQWSRDFKSLVSTIPPFGRGMLLQNYTFLSEWQKIITFAFIISDNSGNVIEKY